MISLDFIYVLHSIQEEMQKLTSTLPDGSVDKPGPDDVFSKVRGNDKYGAADMYGLGVRASDVWGKIPSRAAVRIENCHLKSKNEELSVENVTLKAQLAEKTGSSVSALTTTPCPIVAKVAQHLEVCFYLNSILCFLSFYHLYMFVENGNIGWG